MIACENQRPFNPGGQITGLLEEKNVISEGDRFFFAEDTETSIQRRQQNHPPDSLEKWVYQTLDSGQETTQKVGKTLGLFFLQHKAVIITYPVASEGKIIAAGGIESSLTEIYKDFRRIQKLAFIFVVINSFIFAFFGNHQLSRIYFRPLKRLAKRAETYEDEETLLFSVRKEDNEFSVLSSSLNKMLHRISDDKRVLKETIDSLKTANEELKKAQKDVIRAEKLATVGRLTSGIAHEIGNPIGIVLGYLDLLKQTDLAVSERSDFIDRSEKEITRINNIIRQLLDMSRSSAGEEKSISIHDLLQDLISVFGYQPAANRIVFESRFEASDDRVFADPDQLRQVFLNILLNAVDAVSGNGDDDSRITLVTGGISGHSNLPINPEGSFIKVTIEDNGPGIDSKNLPHIFDPFFTTKQTGKGTGLGLSVSFMIVEKLGGHITASGIEGQGAFFEVILPLATQPDCASIKSFDKQTDGYGKQNKR